MPLSEIEMFRSAIFPVSRHKRATHSVRTPIWQSVIGSSFGITGLALATLIQFGVASTASAAPQDVLLFADRDLGDALSQGLQKVDPNIGPVQVRPFAIDAACSTDAGPAPRLAVMARALTKAQIDRCTQNANADVQSVMVGHQAVALVASSASKVWSMNAAALFRALGQNSDVPRPMNWSDIDPHYPNLPIAVLLPAANSEEQRLFDKSVMEPGCDSTAGAHLPFDIRARTSFCAALRSDIPVTRRQGGVDAIASWAASAPPGQIAVVSVAELAQLDSRVVPLLLDGILPTGVNIDSGHYPVTEAVELLIVVPHAADPAQRNAARIMAFKLLAEASIGPTGTLAPAGLLPLPPTERVAARSQAVAMMENR
jgi:phosphate transport system substrate-binding protein